VSFPADPAPLLAPDAMRIRRFATLRTVTALMLREMSTRYGRQPGGYVWALLQPLAMIVILGFAWSLLMKSPTLGTSFLLFKATGFLALQMFTLQSSVVGMAMKFSRQLLFYPGVTWVDAILARFTLNALVHTLVTAIILYGIIVYDDVRTMLDWGAIVLAMSLAAGAGLGMGCLNCYLFQRFPVWEQAWGIITRPLFLISGVIILYEDMPRLAQDILWYNPVLHITGIMREGFYPVYSPSYVSIIYVMLWVLIPMLLGLILLRRHHRTLLNLA